jgi:fatty acid/phospholipid biosynthesis enzyme
LSPQSHGIAPVAVDAMGGDHAPAAAVQGAVAAARAGQAVILVGPEGRVREELQRQRAPWSLPIRVHHAAEVVEMGEHPGQAMRRKRDNSIRVAFELVRAGEASAMVSAGNSGAVMAGAILVLGRLGAVERPAFAQVLPAVKGRPLLLDMGANVECKPIHLVQFALMGEVWSRRVVGVHRPRAVGQLVKRALRSTLPSKIGVVSHGASDALAIENAVARARDAARAACTEEMAEAAARAPELLAGPPARRRRALEA